MANILVVEDEEVNRDLLKTVLRHAGHSVFGAADETDALQALESVHQVLPVIENALSSNDEVSISASKLPAKSVESNVAHAQRLALMEVIREQSQSSDVHDLSQKYAAAIRRIVTAELAVVVL